VLARAEDLLLALDGQHAALEQRPAFGALIDYIGHSICRCFS
jgi:hypothetical protein